MHTIYSVVFCLFITFVAWAAEPVTPVISPSLFTSAEAITVTYDVTGTPLASLTNAYIWVWIPGKNIDARYNINPASSNTTQTNNAKFTKSVVEGRTLFTITFTPANFFTGDISAETQIGMLLKGNDWSNGQTADYVTTFWDGAFELKLKNPAQQPLFVTTSEEIAIDAEASESADFELFVNDVMIDSKTNVQEYNYALTVTEVSGFSTVTLKATKGDKTDEVSFQYIISMNSIEEVRPVGIIPGINYDDDDPTSVTLCLWAPGKSSAYVRGDFSNWQILPENLMKKDGEYMWIEIEGLTSGQEYAFQCLVDETIFMADPYADKILDPEDQYIPSTSYPDLKSFPQEALSEKWYFNRVSVLQTNQLAYNWQVTDFERPAMEKLTIYELLIRDLFESDARTYQSLIDTIRYFKRLHVNAVELMPVMEFNGNESWGYNPTFMFAPDKYYGPKNKLKEFIDLCHAEGIAVIFDIALNHQDIPNPYALMDFDFSTFKPTPDNKWFNVEATHPYNVFNDLNHESPYTQAYVDTITYYWLHEYKIDGYRFDLSKGFTQTSNPANVGAWLAYDASRIAILKRMADKIWEHAPDAYIILEHFAANSEEKELADYRAEEGKGMMLWGNLNHAYNQNTMGFGTDSAIDGIYHGNRNWNEPRLVGYMESHDEERLMYENRTYGNSSGAYKVKNLNVALKRMQAANVLFYTIPGPKMLWEFGELGYDYSINTCEDGTVADCRLSPKPVRWDYKEVGARSSLFNQTSDLIRLRTTYAVFSEGAATIQGGTSLVKQVTLKNQPYTETPVSSDQMNVKAVANLELSRQNISVEFPHTGTWYDYYEKGEAVSVTATTMTVSLDPGEYKLYTDVPIENMVITNVDNPEIVPLTIFPNPVEDVLQIQSDRDVSLLGMYSMQGTLLMPPRLANGQWDVRLIAKGMYVVKVLSNQKIHWLKVIKN